MAYKLFPSTQEELQEGFWDGFNLCFEHLSVYLPAGFSINNPCNPKDLLTKMTILIQFPNSCADRGSYRKNNIEACWSQLGCRLEKGFREVKKYKKKHEENKLKSLCFMLSCKTYSVFFTFLCFS